MKKFMARHGDLLLESIESIPTKAKTKKDNVLLEGEITGHIHEVLGKGVKTLISHGRTYMAVSVKEAPLVHPEHKTIQIPKGNYKVTRQREFDPYRNLSRQVQD